MNSTGNVTLRSATLADAALVAGMHTRSRAATYRGALPDDYLDHVALDEALALWPDKLKSLLEGAGHLLIAERDGQALGFVCMLAPDERGSVYIDNLHAMPGHQGSGTGTKMLDAARAWAIAQEAAQMHLLVLEANLGAIGFYEAKGWQRAGSQQDTMGGIEITAVVFVLPLG